MTTLHRPHQHGLGLPSAHGEIVRCDGCGQVFRAVMPGNPAYERWQRLGPLRRWWYLTARGLG